MRVHLAPPIAIRAGGLDFEAPVALAVPVRDAVLDVIEPGGEIQPLAAIEVGGERGVEEGAVDGDFEECPLGLAVDCLGV